MINKIKRNISELKVTLRDLERGMDINDKDNLFRDNYDNMEANASNSALNRQLRSGKSSKKRGV